MLQWVADDPHHSFFRNPAGSQPYLYLTEYVRERSLQHWQVAPKDLDILDWGSGKGQVSYLLSQRGLRPQAVDVPDGDHDWVLRERSGAPFQFLDHPWRLPFPDQSFHTVVSFGVLEHVPDDQASLCEIQRVLRPGGLFFCFNLPRSLSWIMRLAHMQGNHYHDRLYTRKGVEVLLDRAQLKLEEYWVRQVFPKNTVRYPFPSVFERVDQWLCEHTPLAYLATSLEFVAMRSR